MWIAQKSPTNNDEGFIYDFIIFEQYQGLGYGKNAMKEIEIIIVHKGNFLYNGEYSSYLNPENDQTLI
ncbi:GNAT family N-acetyltransferase [Peribacillus butanolivorans]|uniref:GNAT family N-acetyltransferase n=1 Tax=Peribacillus butanolivorans TaxID=421767 RepID=UPI00368AD8E0